MTNEEIKELLQIFNESGVAEMEVQRGENRLRLRRAPTTQELAVPRRRRSAATLTAPRLRRPPRQRPRKRRQRTPTTRWSNRPSSEPITMPPRPAPRRS